MKAEDITDFDAWLVHMDHALTDFFGWIDIDPVLLDFSVESLDRIEESLLRRYPSMESLKDKKESQHLDGYARYVGETFRKLAGGVWEIRLDDPNYAFFGIPQINNLGGQKTPACPLILVSTSVSRRTGKFLRLVLSSYLGKGP
ncbi:MAG: hypothetical protein F9K24_22830 [Leptonema illini]|uniref:Uncharacterized protein n=1 Tax=Leptonema illini TaxID=183 RepID=A0A833GUZ1_9LEPT|nr:MAG: hypothetical protein F9K24_22830 [Leptonema illini]